MTKRFGPLGAFTVGLISFAAMLNASCGSTDTPSDPARVDDATDVGPGGADGPKDPDPQDGDGQVGRPSPPGAEEPSSCSAFTEPLPTRASLEGLPFSSDQARSFLLGALALRYPVGKALVEGGMSSGGSLGDCLDAFLTDTSSAKSVLRHASTTVHECGHFYDLGQSKGATSSYVIRPDLTFACESGDTTSRGGKTFARSLLLKDAHQAKRKPCGGGGGAKSCDSYASTYLEGQSGQQGYNLVLEEAAQYVNSLATALAFEEQYVGSRASERDGILTFLWYIERYLALARTSHPDAYQQISEDACWRQLTLTIWDRGWFYLDATKDMATLGLDDDAIEPLVKDPELVAEIEALRRRECP